MQSSRLKILLLALIAVCAIANCGEDGPDDRLEFIRSGFLKLIDRQRVPLDAEQTPLPEVDGISRLHFRISSEKDERVPGLILSKSSDKLQPAVMLLHGTGGKKEDNIPLAKEFIARGFIVVLIDGRHHGERAKGAGIESYNAAILERFKSEKGGYPWLYDTVWDVMRTIDFLEHVISIDKSRIGLMGFSKGGMETYLAAAADPRIAAAVPCIGVQSFKWALENDKWLPRVESVKDGFYGAARSEDLEKKPDSAFAKRFYDRVIPGIYTFFDGPEMLLLISPRPLLAINGDSDPLTPVPGIELCERAARKRYQSDGAEDKLKFIIQPNTKHAVTPESRKEAIDWFVKWLAK